MRSNQIISFNSHEDKIKQLHRDIRAYIVTLDKNIKDEKDSFIVLEYKIKRWEDKKAVLEVALLCLSGEKALADLNSAIKEPSFSHWNNKDGWWDSQTEIFVNKVITRLTKSDLTPSFFLSCFSNHFNLLLPSDIQFYLLLGFLYHPADVFHFAMTSKTNWEFFQKNTVTTFLSSLLDHVALGKYDVAEKTYPKHQTLLTKKGTPSYYLKLDLKRYQYVNLTAFQIALRNAEYKEAEKMGRHLTPQERQKQFNEIFPNGELISYSCQLETAKALLKDVYDAIIVDDVINEDNLNLMTNKTRETVEALYDAVNPEKYKECQKGLVFDVQIYLEALGLYDNNFNTFGNWHRRAFWCVRVEELIASCLPTVYLRAHCLGIGNVVNGNIVNWNKLSGRGCLLADGSSYFNRDPNNRAGLHFFVGYDGARCVPGVGWWGRTDARSIVAFWYAFSKFMSSNNESKDRLYAAIFPHSHLGLSNSMR
ncbi:MAG: hypothetical protein KIT56_09755 [Gammaproteobacteria bacterium]|nr:hypothetical protein [Gammaproteobacteria bacterium]MCW5584136.1 hypothetical protein [Gammaproteobacteria bacterium]